MTVKLITNVLLRILTGDILLHMPEGQSTSKIVYEITVITCDYLWLLVITCDYLWLPVITCDYLWLLVITFVITFKYVRDFLKLFTPRYLRDFPDLRNKIANLK